MKKSYILQKDINQPNDHCAKKGDKFVKINCEVDSPYSNGARIFHPSVVENNPEWFLPLEEEVRPPIGVLPEWLWKEQRLYELQKAYGRYRSANYEVPKEWKDELDQISSWLKSHLPSYHKTYTEEDMRKCFYASKKMQTKDVPNQNFGMQEAVPSFIYFEDYIKTVK